MTSQAGDLAGHFHVGYDEDRAIFIAHVYASDSDRDVWRPAEVSPSLEELLKKCKQRGLIHFDGLTQTAIDEIHRWLVVDRPTLQYVEGLWGTPGPSERGPIGFRPPPTGEARDKGQHE